MARSNVTHLKPDATTADKTVAAKRHKQVRGRAMPSGFRLDLGCGPVCTPGFTGVDRFALDGVSVVADLDGPLPFETETVDYVLASHSLEHVADLPATIAEIFRICRDRAIITIIGPYHNTGLNRANVYHSQVFNEHTMRFFTDRSDNAHIEAAEYTFPHADVWGLLGSDHSEHDYDIRVLSQEFFYFAPFRGLSPEMKTVFRKTLNDVCDQMIVHAVVAKSPMGAVEEAAILRNTQFAETESLRYRRQLEEQTGQPSIWSALADIPEGFANLEERYGRLEQQLVSLERRSGDSGAQLDIIADNARNDAARFEHLFTGLQSDAERFGQALREEHGLRESHAEAINAEQQSIAKRLDEIERQSRQNAQELNAGLSAVADTLAEFNKTRDWSEAATDSRFEGITHGFDGLKQDAQRFVEALREEHGLRENHAEAINAEQQSVAKRLDEIERQSRQNAQELNAGLSAVADTLAEFNKTRD
ncbi:MAG: methyltransferase domain-containing protein, partial [Rhizobiaceae bacterium]